MEDIIQQRRNRPPPRSESISSRKTTSNSSISSSVHQSSRNQRGRDSAGASMLQERLRERKVESARQSRRQSFDIGAIDNRAQSSPATRDDRRPSSSGVGATKSKNSMGAKQIEEQVSTLHKQNFDLKLELYHRRERQEKLEARIAAAEARLAEQDELQEVNEQLLAELEKRDQAVEEAVGIICDLEEKVQQLMEEREIVRKFDAQNDAGYFGANHDDGPASSPPSFTPRDGSNSNQSKSSGKAANRLPRMPSFLSDQSEGAEALRSLYNPADRGYSGSNLPKLLEDGSTADGMNSPRLSILSESSFLSVYGEKQLSPDAAESRDEVERGSPPRRRRTSSSVEKWVDGSPAKSDVQSRPVARSRAASSSRPSQLLSINSVLESPLQRLERGEHRLEKLRMKLEKGNTSTMSRPPSQLERATSGQEKRHSRETMRRTDGASFEHQQTLPPTPDTISTSTLRHYKDSNDTLHDGKQQLDGNEEMYITGGPKFPVPSATHNAYQSMLSVRPQSIGETIASRREGHGWDAETHDDLTEAGSISSTCSTYGPTLQKGPVAPDLFSFGAPDDGRTWARDVMFSHDSATRRPAHGQLRSDNYDRSSRTQPRSDATITPDLKSHSGFKKSRYASESTQYSTSPIDTSPRPDPPARRSSLSAASKLRKAPPSINHQRQESQAVSTATSPSSKEGKRSRFTGLFSRSTTSPSINGQYHKAESSTSSSSNTNNLGQSPSNGSPMIANGQRGDYRRNESQSQASDPYIDEDDLTSATPPPIARSRTTQAYVRPSSAGVGAVRRETAFADGFSDGPKDRASVEIERGIGNDEASTRNQGGRKWLGRLGRSGSLSKRT